MFDSATALCLCLNAYSGVTTLPFRAPRLFRRGVPRTADCRDQSEGKISYNCTVPTCRPGRLGNANPPFGAWLPRPLGRGVPCTVGCCDQSEEESAECKLSNGTTMAETISTIGITIMALEFVLLAKHRAKGVRIPCETWLWSLCY